MVPFHFILLSCFYYYILYQISLQPLLNTYTKMHGEEAIFISLFALTIYQLHIVLSLFLSSPPTHTHTHICLLDQDAIRSLQHPSILSCSFFIFLPLIFFSLSLLPFFYFVFSLTETLSLFLPHTHTLSHTSPPTHTLTHVCLLDQDERRSPIYIYSLPLFLPLAFSFSLFLYFTHSFVFHLSYPPPSTHICLYDKDATKTHIFPQISLSLSLFFTISLLHTLFCLSLLPTPSYTHLLV